MTQAKRIDNARVQGFASDARMPDGDYYSGPLWRDWSDGSTFPFVLYGNERVYVSLCLDDCRYHAIVIVESR